MTLQLWLNLCMKADPQLSPAMLILISGCLACMSPLPLGHHVGRFTVLVTSEGVRLISLSRWCGVVIHLSPISAWRNCYHPKDDLP